MYSEKIGNIILNVQNFEKKPLQIYYLISMKKPYFWKKNHLSKFKPIWTNSATIWEQFAKNQLTGYSCHYSFLLSLNLVGSQLKLLTHTLFFYFPGQKPHECYKCGKRFALGCNMKAHLKTHDTNRLLSDDSKDLNPGPLDEEEMLIKEEEDMMLNVIDWIFMSSRHVFKEVILNLICFDLTWLDLVILISLAQ